MSKYIVGVALIGIFLSMGMAVIQPPPVLYDPPPKPQVKWVVREISIEQEIPPDWEPFASTVHTRTYGEEVGNPTLKTWSNLLIRKRVQ